MKTRSDTSPPLDGTRLQTFLRGAIPALDGIRGLAILAVLAHQLLLEPAEIGGWLRWLWCLPEAGGVGVQLFFVLSGFLITGILLETRDAKNRWSSFFARRALRIFPPYYFVLIVLFVVLPRFLALPPDFSAGLKRQSWYWLYIANWSLLGDGGVAALGHCWSLSVEEQFYLLWPPLVFALRARSLVWVCLLAAMMALVTRMWIVLSGKNLEYAYELTVARMDALAIGALTARLVRHPTAVAASLPRARRCGAALLVTLVAAAASSGGYARRNAVTLTVGHTVLAVGAAYLIVVAVLDNARGSGWVGAVCAWSPFRLFGKHSYAIYLFHHPLDLAVNQLFLGKWTGRLSQWQYIVVQTAYLVVGSGLLLGIAMLFHVLFERPILNLKRYFVARRTHDERIAPSVPT
jgi:peptidoglycan/LPS O-acetylase OafA/YrhL